MRVSLSIYFYLFVFVLFFGLNSNSLFAQYSTDFTANTTEICEDESVTFTPTIVPTPNQYQYLTWNLDGQNVNAPYSPFNYVFEDAGIYSPSLSYQNDNVTRTDYVTVNPNPVSSLQNNPWEWVHSVSAPLGSTTGQGYHPNPVNADIDSKGNLYIGGQWDGQITTDNNNPPYENYPPSVTKFDKLGNIKWEIPNAAQVVVDDFDNVFAVGQFTSTIDLPSSSCGSVTVSSSLSHSWFLAKYSSNGELLWANTIEGNNAMADILLATGGGKLYAVGKFWQANTVSATGQNNTNQSVTGATQKTFILEYSTNTGELHQNIHTISNLYIREVYTYGSEDYLRRSVSADRNGNLYITMPTESQVYFDNNLILDESANNIITNQAMHIYIKYKDDAIQTIKSVFPTGRSDAWMLSKHTTDDEGNMYWSIRTVEGQIWSVFGQTYPYADHYLIKINPLGDIVWSRSIKIGRAVGGANFFSQTHAITVDNNNQVFLLDKNKLHFYDGENGNKLREPVEVGYSNVPDLMTARNGMLYLGNVIQTPTSSFMIGSHTIDPIPSSVPLIYSQAFIAKYNYNQTLPQNRSIDLQATLQTGAPSVSYQWYKDGNVINGATSATYTANQIGFYQVETTTAQGCSRRSVGQYLSEPATFLVSDNEVCVGEPIILEATDLLGTNTEWNFGLDGSPNLINASTNQSGEIKQGVTYTEAGTKTITYQDGTTSLTENVTVRPLPVSSELSISNTSSLSIIDTTTTLTYSGISALPVIATATGDGNNMYFGKSNGFSGNSSIPKTSLIKRNIYDEIVWEYELDGIAEINKIQYDNNGGVYVFAQTIRPIYMSHTTATFRGANQTITRLIERTTFLRPIYFVIKYDTDGNLLHVIQTEFCQFEATTNGFYLTYGLTEALPPTSLVYSSSFGEFRVDVTTNPNRVMMARFDSNMNFQWVKEADNAKILPTAHSMGGADSHVISNSDEDLFIIYQALNDTIEFDNQTYIKNCIPEVTNRGGIGIIKVSSTGQLLWADILSTSGTPTINNEARNNERLEIDNQGNILVLTKIREGSDLYSSENGRVTDFLNVDTHTSRTDFKNRVLIKYNTNGGIEWNKNIGYDYYEITTLETNKTNNIFIVFNTANVFGDIPQTNLSNLPSNQVTIVELNAKTGNVVQYISPEVENISWNCFYLSFNKLNSLYFSYIDYQFTGGGGTGGGSALNYKNILKKYGSNICIDEGTTISIQNTQPNTTYTWFKNGQNTGNNGTSITITEEGTYSVEAENEFGCRQSSAATHFSLFPEVQILPQQNPVIGYGSAVIGALATPLGRDYEYQWQFNGVDILNATSPILIANESGNYQVKVVSEDACEIISDVKEVQIRIRNGRATIINDSLTLVSDRASSATSTFSEGLDVDVNGEFIFEGGVFSNNLTFGSNSLTSRGLQDGYLVKRDTTGNILWNRSWGSNGDDQTNSIATTTEGEAIIGGYFNQTVTIGDTTIISKGETDGILAKYAANGDFVWAVSTAGDQNDQITSVATDLGGHAIAAGFTTNAATVSTLRTDTTFTQSGENAFVIRYQPNGKLLWANQLISPVSAKSTTVTTDIFGDVFVAGAFKTSLSATDENGTNLNLNGTTAELGFVAKYDEYGRLLWLKSLPKVAKGIDTDDFGNVFITGQEFLYSFLPNGQSRFEETFPANAIISNIAVGRSGKIAISGHFTRTLNGNAANRNEEGFVSYFLPNGTLLDTQIQGGTQNDRINGVSFDDLGNVYTTGFYENSMTLGENTLSNNGRASVFNRFQPILVGCDLDILAQNHANTGFEWTENGQNIENGTTLNFSNGNAYLLVGATENGFMTQDGVRIQTQTAVTDLGEDQNSCQIITLDAGDNEGNGFTRFEWYKDNILITGEENQTLEVNESGTYKVIAFTSQDCQATDEVNLTVAPLEVLMSVQNDTLVCEDSPIELIGIGADTYIYFKNNNPIGTGNSLTVLDAQNGDSFYVEGTRTSDNCINSSIPIMVNTKTIPQIDLGLNDQYFCSNDTLQLTANLTSSTNSNQYIFDWYRIEPSQTTAERIGNGREELNIIQSGKYFVIVSNSDNNVSCNRISDTVTVNTYDLPVVSVQDVHICDTAQNAKLSASDISHGNMISYEWKNLITGQNVGTDSILFVTDEDFYQVKVTNTSTGCSVLDTAKAFFHTTPNFEIRGYENPLCDRNDTLFIEATNLQDYSVEWFGNGIVSTVSTTQNQSIVINRSGIYTVTVTDTQTGCSTTKTQEVIINQIPILSSLPQSSIQNPIQVCQGDSVVLDAFDATHEPNAIYEWVRLSNRNAATQTLSTSPKVALTYEETLGLMPFAYQVKVSYPTTNCFITDTVFVQFKRKSNVIATSNKAQICLGEEVNFEATGATSYLWNDGNTNAIRTVQPDSVGAWTYIIEGKYDNDCNSSFDTIIVKVNPIPVAQIEEESIILCENERLQIDGFLPQHSVTSRYVWTHVENNQVLSNNTELNTSFNQILPISYEPFTLRLTVFDSLTNCESSDEVRVKFNRSSNVKITENYPSKICINEEVTFTATGATSYSWKKLNDTSNVVLDSTNQVTIQLVSTGFHTFIVEGSYQNGCNSTFDTVSVFVNPVPQIKAHIADSINICAGNSVLLLPSGGVSYTWQHNPTAKDSISVSPTKSTTYYVIGTDENGCQNIDSVFIYVTPTFELPNLIQLCQGEIITIGDTLSSDLNAVYEWLPTKEKTPFITVSKSGIYTVKVNVENCEFERSIEIQIKEKPVIELVADTVLCFEAGAEERFERNLSHNLGSVITNYDSSATYLYVWTDENEQIIGTQPNLEINEGGNYRLRVIARYGNNCEVTDSILVTELCQPRIFIPEAFTPNNDNLNDYFEIFGKHAIDFEMQIFDRWGQVMYQLNAANIEDLSQEEFWDGTYKGKQVPTGAYIWIIRYSSPIDKTAKQIQKTGSLMIIR